MEPFLLLCSLHNELLRMLPVKAGRQFEGLQHAARWFRKTGHFDNRMAKKVSHLDIAFNLTRHLSVPGNDNFVKNIPDCLMDPEKVVAEAIDAKSGLENYCLTIRNSLQEESHSTKFTSDNKDDFEKAVQDKLDWLDKSQLAKKDEIEAKQKELEGVIGTIMLEMHCKSLRDKMCDPMRARFHARAIDEQELTEFTLPLIVGSFGDAAIGSAKVALTLKFLDSVARKEIKNMIDFWFPGGCTV